MSENNFSIAWKDILQLAIMLVGVGIIYGSTTYKVDNLQSEIKELKSEIKELNKTYENKIDRIYLELLRKRSN